jgi:hypothetical protein
MQSDSVIKSDFFSLFDSIIICFVQVDEMQSNANWCSEFVRAWHAGYTVNEHNQKMCTNGSTANGDMEMDR